MEYVSVAGGVKVFCSEDNLCKLRSLNTSLLAIQHDGLFSLSFSEERMNHVLVEISAETVVSGFTEVERYFKELASIVTRESSITIVRDRPLDPWHNQVTLRS